MKKETKRILIVDDNESIHEDFNKILLQTSKEEDLSFKELEDDLFGDDSITSNDQGGETEFPISFEADHAYQGEDSIRMVKKAVEEGFPYSLIFMDVRMPPGMDGIQAISEIWKVYPYTEIVICTAYSDYSWDQIFEKFGSTDHLLFLKKPFDSVTVKQISLTLIKKWELDRQSRLQTKKLEGEVEARTEELQSMIEELEKIKAQNKLPFISKSDFIENISYELKTPLNGILGVTDLLLDTNLNNEQRDFAKIIKSSSNSMLLTVNDLLDFSNFNEGAIDIKNIGFNLRTSVDYVTDLAAILVHNKNLEISTLIHADVPEQLIGDPLRIRQILLNLISNAVKTTPEGEITLLVSVEKGDDRQEGEVKIGFEIIDTSDGTSVEDTQHLLRSDHKLSDLTASQDEYHYNILIAKELVELMGGELGLNSSHNTGKSLSFFLKFKYDPSPTGTAVLVTKTLKESNCLIFGDNSTSRKVLSLYIKHWGGQCDIVENIEAAKEKMRLSSQTGTPYDIVLVDIDEGELKKKEYVADALRETKELGNIPLVYITGKAKRGDALHLKNFGYKAYLTKPIKQSHLYNCIRLIKGGLTDTDGSHDIITKHAIDEKLDDHVRVLIADQNINDQKRLSKIFNSLKVRCDVIENLEKFEKRMTSGLYDMVFVKYSLVKEKNINPAVSVSGNTESVKPTPVVVISDTPLTDSEKEQISPIAEVILKPYRYNEIQVTLQKYLDCFSV